MWNSVLEISRRDKKGVTLHVHGQTIIGVVQEIREDHVILSSREYSRIVVRLDSVDAAAI